MTGKRPLAALVRLLRAVAEQDRKDRNQTPPVTPPTDRPVRQRKTRSKGFRKRPPMK
jgi:hypothetical protein